MQGRAADGRGRGQLAEAGAQGWHPPEPAQNLTGTAEEGHGRHTACHDPFLCRRART